MKANYHELFQRYSDNPILTAEHWSYPVHSVFNCGATKVKGETLLLARVEEFRGFSHLTVARSKDGISNWTIDSKPSLQPDPVNFPEEVWGVEDPRITWVEELREYYIAFTAFSRGGPLVSLAKTTDFVSFERLGPVMPPEDKDAALFPVKFGGNWAMLHRPTSGAPNAGAHIWISFSPDLYHWGGHRIVMRARDGGWWDANKIGLSPPPLRIPEGWLIMYHGVRRTGGGVIYRLGLALLNTEDPTKLLRRGDEWIFGPRMPYERDGDVDDVVFPGGWTVENEQLRIYYGGADACIALATAKLSDIREYIRHCPEEKQPSRWD
jgi:predicted GH43/DUF377 family glycosyl hydrolase